MRTEMVQAIDAGRHTDRSATPRGRDRRARPRSTCASTRSSKMADKVILYKYVVKNVEEAGKTATFMCRSRSSRTTARACTCTSRSGRGASRSSSTRPGYAGLSDMGLLRIGGLASARCRAIGRSPIRPLTPYKRLVPGCEAPVAISCTARRNRSGVGAHPGCIDRTRRRNASSSAPPDGSSNPYLVLSRRCSWRASTASSTASSPATRSTRTSTTYPAQRCELQAGSAGSGLAQREPRVST